MMEDLNWTNVNVNYTMSSQFVETGVTEEVSHTMLNVSWLILLFFIFLGFVGMIIELTKIGDVENLNYETLEPQAKFQNTR